MPQRELEHTDQKSIVTAMKDLDHQVGTDLTDHVSDV